MKAFISFLISILFIGIGVAQENSNIEQLLQRLNENHIGPISEVFSAEEQALLQNYFLQGDSEDPISESLGVVIHGVNDQDNIFGNFDITTPGNFNPVSTSPVLDFEGAGVYDPWDDVYYSIDSANNIWAIDPVTGVYANFGVVTPPAGETFTGLEIDPQTGDVYGLSTDGVVSTLSRIDLDTLVVTPIGLTGMVLGIAIGIDLSGTIYSYDIDDDNLYSLNAATGAKSLIGNIGFNANFGQGMYRDSGSGNLYMSAFNNSTFNSQLRLVNTTTGSTTNLGTITGSLSQFGWGSIQQPLLGIDDVVSENIKIYPNPAIDNLYLNATESVEAISIYTLQGHLVLQETINSLKAKINIGSLASGSYLLSATINGKKGTYKFLKL